MTDLLLFLDRQVVAALMWIVLGGTLALCLIYLALERRRR